MNTPTPKNGLTKAAQPTEAVPLEIARLRDGETIEIRPDDNRLYTVQSGTIQRIVELPSRKGPISLELGRIEPGCCWYPASALRHASNFRFSLQFRTIGLTMVTKTEDDGLPKDREKLLSVLRSLSDAASRQTASAEATILHHAERADKAEGDAHSSTSLCNAISEELEEVRTDLAAAQTEQVRLQRELDRALLAASVLREETKQLWSKLRAAEKARNQERDEADARIADLQQEKIDYARWVERNFPDHPDVQDGRFALSIMDVESEINRAFDELDIVTDVTRKAIGSAGDVNTERLEPTSAPAVMTDEPFEVLKDEMSLAMDEPASERRPTIPFEVPDGSPPHHINVPPPSHAPTFEELCRTQSMGVVELPPQTQASPATQAIPAPDSWRDSLMDDALLDFLQDEPRIQPPISVPMSHTAPGREPPRPRFDTLDYEDGLPAPVPTSKKAALPPLPPHTSPRRK